MMCVYTRCAPPRKFQLTVNYVHLYTTGIRVTRLACVDTGIARHGFLDHQTTRCFRPFFRDETNAAARRIEIDNLKQNYSIPLTDFFLFILTDTTELHARNPMHN